VVAFIGRTARGFVIEIEIGHVRGTERERGRVKETERERGRVKETERGRGRVRGTEREKGRGNETERERGRGNETGKERSPEIVIANANVRGRGTEKGIETGIGIGTEIATGTGEVGAQGTETIDETGIVSVSVIVIESAVMLVPNGRGSSRLIGMFLGGECECEGARRLPTLNMTPCHLWPFFGVIVLDI
jgi:hypothetical protein